MGGADYQVVGIDVDHYGDKRGGNQLAALEAELGPLSDRAPWISSSRVDGVSGIRWYLAPVKNSNGESIEFRSKADQAIDLIQRKHRYAVVWPSVVENRRYWWFPPGVTLTEDGRAHWRESDPLPVIADFPILSPSWVTYLGKHRSHSGETDNKISVTDLELWVTATFKDGKASQMCWNVASAAATWGRRIAEEESSHDKITDAHWMLYRLAAEGHTGWAAAVKDIETDWLDKVRNAGKRALTEANSEIFRSRTGAQRKIKVRVDRDGVRAVCTCVGAGLNLPAGTAANLWPTEKAPMPLARQFALMNDREETPLARWRGDWYQYTGQRWRVLENDDFAKLIYECLESAVCLKESTSNGVTTYRAVPWNPTDRKVAAVEHALRAVALLDSENVEAPCWLDSNRDQVIAFGNTLLRIGDRKQIDHTPDYFNLNVLPFDYDPLADEPKRWLRFLAELWPDDSDSVALLQEWFGYVLSGQTNMHKMLTLIGPRRTGKTMIAHILRSLVGAENQTGARSADIVSQFGAASLVGRTLATFDDDRITGDARKFVDFLKDVIGEGQVTADRKYRDPWCGKLSTRFVYIANELSAFPDSSGAIIERMLVLKTQISFEANPDRQLRKTLEAELPGIFNWALDGLDRLNAGGYFTVPASSRQVSDDLYATASPITEFVDETCAWDSEGYVSRVVLFARWKTWCDSNNYSPGNIGTFLSKLRAAYGDKITEAKRGGRGKQQRSCTGLRLLENFDNVIVMKRDAVGTKPTVVTTVATSGEAKNGV